MRIAPIVVLVLVSGCARSHGRAPRRDDASIARDARSDGPIRDARAPVFDAGPVVRPDGGATCEGVFSERSGPRSCVAGERDSCGRERCCDLVVQCLDGTLTAGAYREGVFLPGGIACDDPPEPSCAQRGPETASLAVTWAGRSFRLSHAYASHSVGFATYLDLTFTTSGAADACTTQRLGITQIPPRPTIDGAYDGAYEVRVQLTDLTRDPPFRFANGRLQITRSLPLPSAGPVSGRLEVADGDLTIAGTFEAPECEEWRRIGS